MAWWRQLPIRAKLTFWYTLSLSILLVIFAGLIHVFLKKALFESIDNQLLDDFELAVEIIDFDEAGAITLHANKQFDDSIYRHEKRWLEVWAQESDTLIYPTSSQLGDLPADCSKRNNGYTSISINDGTRLRLYCTNLSIGLNHTTIRVGRSEEFIHYELSELLMIIAIFLPLGLMISAIGGTFLAGRALAPVQAMTSRAESISADHLDVRIPVENSDDELGKLAIVVNKSFDRLQNSFNHMRRFTSDASHELRTPLTAMRTVGDVGLKTKTTVSDCKDVIRSMLEEAKSMSTLVDRLLTLSRMDSNQISLQIEKQNAYQLIQDSLEPLNKEAVAQEVSIANKVSPDALVTCDPSLLRQAIRNLIQNAIKFNKKGGTITIVHANLEKQTQLKISDTGRGIPAEHLPHIFERFYRSDSARSRHMGGFGLGLAIAQLIVGFHGGSIQVESHVDQGSTFSIFLPKKETR